MTRFLLVRHGQSTWNESGKWQGQADPPLTELGRRQASEASAAVGAVDAIVSSTLDRAHETAQIIAARLGIGPVLALDGLVERDAGEWSGLTRSEIDHRYPGYLDDGRRPPGWESDEALTQRLLGTLDAIGSRFPDGDLLVVTHGGCIMNLERMLGAPHHRVANLGGRWFQGLGDRGYLLGERIDLLDGRDVTIPDQI